MALEPGRAHDATSPLCIRPWLRSLIEAVSPDADAGVTAKQLPSLFAAANVSPPADVLEAAARRAAAVPLKFAEVETLLANLLEDGATPLGGLFRQYAGVVDADALQQQGPAGAGAGAGAAWTPAPRMSLAGWTRFCREQQHSKVKVAVLVAP